MANRFVWVRRFSSKAREHDEAGYESIGDYHRNAALHYSQASKHHSLAADADDQDHEELSEDDLDEIEAALITCKW